MNRGVDYVSLAARHTRFTLVTPLDSRFQALDSRFRALDSQLNSHFFAGGRHVGPLDFLNFGRDASTSQAPGVTSVTSCRQRHYSTTGAGHASMAAPARSL